MYYTLYLTLFLFLSHASQTEQCTSKVSQIVQDNQKLRGLNLIHSFVLEISLLEFVGVFTEDTRKMLHWDKEL